MDTLRTILPPIHPEGYRFGLIFSGVTIALFFLSTPLGWLGVIATLWCLYFFRDPARVVPEIDKAVIAPADGVVLPVVEVVPPAELGLGKKRLQRISIFMNVFNVHVNRAPVSGEVTHLHYVAGKFFNASLDKASEDNERQLITVKTPGGDSVGFVQIAGLVARRIVCALEVGDEVEAGERFGLIRFGSRVDVYLPASMAPLVVEGQTTIAGETVLAQAGKGKAARRGHTV